MVGTWLIDKNKSIFFLSAAIVAVGCAPAL